MVLSVISMFGVDRPPDYSASSDPSPAQSFSRDIPRRLLDRIPKWGGDGDDHYSSVAYVLYRFG